VSCRAAGVLSHRGLQGIPQRGAARRTCASFPETHIFFRDRFRSPYANQVISDTALEGLDALRLPPASVQHTLWER